MSLKTVLILTALFACQLVSGQTGAGFMRLGVNEGLSQNSVREIFQDRQGFIWIGTGDGLNRYDGIQIKKYRQSFRDKSSKRFPGKIINGKIHEDKNGNLWMMVDGQLVMMNVVTETFTVIKKLGADLEYSIVGLQGGHVFIINATDLCIVHPANGTVDKVTLPDIFGFYHEAENGGYLLYRKGNGVFRYDHVRQTHERVLHTGNDSLLNACVTNATLLVATHGQVQEFSLPQRRFTASYTIPGPLRNKSLYPVLKAHNGNIIALVPQLGIAIIDSIKRTFHHYTNIENDPFSLSSNLIYTALIDHSNNMWLGTEGGGISRLNLKQPLFAGFPDAVRTKSESSFMMVKSIYHHDKKIYVGTYAKGLYVIDRFTSSHQVLFDPSKTEGELFQGIFFITKDQRGRVWLNRGNEVGVADLGKGQFLSSVSIDYYRKGRRHNIPQCFAQVSDSAYVLGTVQSAYLIEEKNNRLSLIDLGLSDHELEGDIQTVFRKSNGDVIIGKGEGEGFVVLRWSGDKKPEIVERGLTGLTIKHIYRDELRKAFWFATDLGIVILRDNAKKETLIDETSGLSNDFIYSIVPENDYSFWVSTNKGINRISLQQDTTLTVKSIEQYATQHGLQSNEFNTGAHFRDEHLIFFGGVTGINWFDYRKFFKRSFSGRSYITDVLVNEKPITGDTAINFLKKINLDYKGNNLLIRFATLDYTNPSVNHYLYRLTGYDKEWINAGNIPEARYNKLPHGDYEFEVSSSNSEGVWSAPVTLLYIRISPPFWITWWFRLVTAVSVAALIYFLSRYFLKRKLEKKLHAVEQQLAVNHERLRISRDMHDELGTGLSKIALLSEVGKTDYIPEKNSKIINEISDTSRKLADKMGEIIWTLNPQNDTLGNLAAYLKEYLYETTDSLPVKVTVNFPLQIPDISLGHMFRQQLMLVTKEAVNNALKYAGASHIDFLLSIDARTISFSVKDNGSGFDTAALGQQKNGRRNGLTNMRARMESVGGHFVIQSTPGNGTEITYGIPI